MIAEPFDFSELDVTAGWDAAVGRTLIRLDAVARRRTNPLVMVERWQRRILAASAFVLLFCGARIVQERALEAKRTDAASLAAWALAGDQPAGDAIADLLTRTRP